MPAQRTCVPACLASGHQPDAPPVPPLYSRHLPAASTPSTTTLVGHLTTVPADSGPALTDPLSVPAPTCRSTAPLCMQLDRLRTALADAGHVDGQVLDLLIATLAGLSTAVTNTVGRTPATTVIAPRRDYWRQQRLSRGWTQTQVITRLQHLAAHHGHTIPDRDSLQIMVSRWETGRTGMSPHYQRLFHRLYDLPTEQATTVRTEAVAR